MSKYKQLYVDNAAIKFNWKTNYLKFACCDCGLVHDFHFIVENNILMILVKRNDKSTSQFRRHKNASLCRKTQR